jgi:hypothetical protein
MSASDTVVPQSSRFWCIAGTGAAFQAGASAIIVATLVFQLTGSAFAVLRSFARVCLNGGRMPSLREPDKSKKRIKKNAMH